MVFFSLPYDALEHDELHHKRLREVAVHGLEQRDTHDKCVGQGGEREESDEPVQRASREENCPEGQK